MRQSTKLNPELRACTQIIVTIDLHVFLRKEEIKIGKQKSQ